MSFCEEVDCSADVACPEFANDVGHGNRSIVAQVSNVSFFVEEGGDALHPVGWCVLCFPEELKESEGEGVEVIRGPFDSLIC